jgi:hypothetical protein
MMFDRHEIVFANGTPAESLNPGIEAMNTLDNEAQQEILDIFPELSFRSSGFQYARRPLFSYEARSLGHALSPRSQV